MPARTRSTWKVNNRFRDTFRIRGAKYWSSIGLDAIAVQVGIRCCLVLTYLAEVPLQGLANRVRPLAQSGQKQELQATGVWQANQLHQRADAQDALEVEKRRRKDLSFARDTVLELERKCEDLSNIVEGSPCSGSRSTDGDLACSEH